MTIRRVGRCDHCRSGVWSIDDAPETCLCDDTPPYEVLEAHCDWLRNGCEFSLEELTRDRYNDVLGPYRLGDLLVEQADQFAADHRLGRHARPPLRIQSRTCPACGRESDGDLCRGCVEEDARVFDEPKPAASFSPGSPEAA